MKNNIFGISEKIEDFGCEVFFYLSIFDLRLPLVTLDDAGNSIFYRIRNLRKKWSL